MPKKHRRFRDESGSEAGYTYYGTDSQRQWLAQNLDPLVQGKWITGVLYTVKSGKEATVYCCAAHPSTGVDLLAAKVYRPYRARAMVNDALYREGRDTRDERGRVVRDRRRRRAMRKSGWGRQEGMASWIEHEYETLYLLHDVGVDVPAPYAQIGHTILIEYLGDEEQPAPMLSRVRLSPDEAQPLYERLMVNVELMLACGCVHADLSPFNVLYWQGEVKVIDFPQAVDVYRNPSAFYLFHRDIDRLCRYFEQWGVACAPFTLATEIWGRYIRGPLSDRAFAEHSST
jgi:RIO kinase 1